MEYSKDQFMVLTRSKLLISTLIAFIVGALLSRYISGVSVPDVTAIAIKNNLYFPVSEIRVVGCGYSGMKENLQSGDVAVFAHVISCGEDHYRINLKYPDGSVKKFEEGYISPGLGEYTTFLELSNSGLVPSQRPSNLYRNSSEQKVP